MTRMPEQKSPRRKRLTREESREQTRSLILEAATELFMERGVSGTSVEQIAERAGFTRGAFYSNYEDKHALVVELLKRRQAAPSINLNNFRDELGAWHRRREENLAGWFTLRVELILYALRNPEVRELLAGRERDVWSTLSRGIESEITNAGKPLAGHARLLGLILHALDDGLFIQRLLRPEDVTEEDIGAAVEVLLHSWGIAAEAEAQTKADDEKTGTETGKSPSAKPAAAVKKRA